MRIFGIVLVTAGLILAIVTGVKFFTKKKVLEVGKLEITKDEPYQFDWSPLVGVGVMLVGGVVIVVSMKK